MLTCTRALVAAILTTFLLSGQSQNSSITGTITDPSGGMIPNAELTLTSLQRGTAMKATTGQEGLFTFPNLEPGTYELKVAAAGFRPALVRPIAVTINQIVRNDVRLDVGTDVQTVEVQATAPQLNFENASRSEGVTPETLNELPLIVSGGPRNSAQFTVLLPGVTTGGGNNAFDARINGGLQSGDEAIMDGASMQEGHMSQSGMVAFADFRMTPDMISEFRVLTSTYEPEYGSSTGGQIIAVTKSGTNSLHGGGFEYLRNKALNATQFTNDRGPGDQRPKDNEHEFGGFLGGPVIIPKIYKGKGWARSYFFTDVEFFRIRGGASRPTLSIASTQERQGDFTDWPYPIYDPKSTRLNPNFNASAGESASNPKYIRDQVSCNGRLNVICPDRISPLSLGWLKYLPTPTSAGPLNNYLVPQPVPDSILADANHFLIKIDQYLGNSDHVAATIWRQKTPAKFFSVLPIQLASETFSDPQNSWVSRMNYDHTFTPTLLNHAAFGYLNRNEGYGAVDYQHAGDVPKIAGVPSIEYPPELRFGNGFEGFGNTAGIPTGNVTTRPTYVVNDMATWIKGRHTFKFGGEYRSIEGNIHTNSNLSGHFQFEAAQTGLPTVEGSGNAMASFLLGAVHDANVNLYSIASRYPRQKAYIWHVGDTWKATNKLSINYGIRWDKFTPSREKRNAMSFFDFGPNPGAGGRPGRLAFATEDHPYPEADWNAGWGPRLGVAYAWNDKTVIRTGYGIFYTQAFYPGWGGGISQQGLNNEGASVGTTGLGGLDPAFYLDQGFPINNVKKPPFVDPSFANGQGILYRPTDGNRLAYSQQWNFTVERQVTANFMVSAAYVANKGTRLPSQLSPLNVLNPNLLAKGSALTDEFGPNDTVVDGVSAPYPGWAQQLLSANNCRPSVAQALLPFPQFCDSLTGLNENLGSSTYHSFQFKAEKRYSAGLYTLFAYTHSKLLTSATGNTQATAGPWNQQTGVISPFEMKRNKALAPDDVPNSVSLAFVYEIPLGRGKRYMNSLGFLNRAVAGWEITGTYKYSGGVPLFFRSGTCNVPSQFRVACIPGVLPGKSVFAQSLDNYDVNKPLFDKSAFESPSSFNYYYGVGPRITNIRTFSYKDFDMGVGKRTWITERVNFLIRAEAFNAVNSHNFTRAGWGGDLPFNTDISSADFGKWNGAVSPPRNIQLVGRIEF